MVIKKYTALLLVCIFFGPWLLAWLVFTYAPDALSTRHHGALLTSPVLVDDDIQRALRDDSGVEGWVWVFFEDLSCPLPCEKLVRYHQIHKALGKEAARLTRVYVASALDVQQTALLPKGMRVLMLSSERIEQWKKLIGQQEVFGEDFSSVSGDLILPKEMSILIDPRDFILMIYSNEHRNKGILKDIKRLLKVSQIG